MRMVRLSVMIAALIVSLSAAAEDKEAARKAFVEGTKYYNLNQYEDALASFKRAYWNYEDPSFLFNIAQCHRALKHKSEAVEFYRSYLRNAPDTPKRADVQRIIAELEAAMEQERVVATAPPQGTLAATPTPAATAPALTTPAPAATEKPVWKKGWFWGVVAGAAVVVGVGVGLGVGLGTAAKNPSPSFGSLTVD